MDVLTVKNNLPVIIETFILILSALIMVYYVTL